MRIPKNPHLQMYSLQKPFSTHLGYEVRALKTVKGKRTRGIIGVTSPLVKNAFPPTERFYYFYPAQEHFELFVGASRNRFRGSAGDTNPGLVGTVSVNERKNCWDIKYLQAHFKVGDRGMTKQIAKQYLRWRLHALQALFEEADRKKVSEIKLLPTNRGRDEQKKKEFTQIAQKFGFRVTEEVASTSDLSTWMRKRCLVARKNPALAR